LHIDNFRFWTNEKLVNASFSVINTPDNQTLYNQDIFYLVEVRTKQQRLKVSFPTNDNDREYTNVVLSTTMDSCKQFFGVRSNPIIKVFMEHFNMTGFGCPFKTGFNYKITNMTCSDNLLPPLPVEVKYKFEANAYGQIKGRKGWNPLYGLESYGIYKK
jgi:hypothetical protein